jgi:hypothetical protein
MNEIEAVGAEVLLTSSEPGGAAAGKERPWLYSLLIAPSAVMMNGVVQGGALAYLLSEQGVKSGEQSHIIQILALPTSLYFLWSPITDFLIRRRTWLLIGSLMAGVLMESDFNHGIGPDLIKRLLQPTGGVELRRDDGGDPAGAIAPRGE